MRSARSSPAARPELTAERHQRREVIGLEDRLDALLDQRHAIEAEPGVDVLGGERRQRPGRILVELHEDEVPVLEETLVLAAWKIAGRAVLRSAVQVELAARPAGAGRAGLPEVLRARTEDDPLTRHADRLPGGDRLLVRADPERVVALEDRDPDVLRPEPEAVQREFPGQLDRALLEVLPYGEVAEHLEEGEVPRRVADVLDVGRPEALLSARQEPSRAASRCRGSSPSAGAFPPSSAAPTRRTSRAPGTPTAGAGAREPRRTPGRSRGSRPWTRSSGDRRTTHDRRRRAAERRSVRARPPRRAR